MYYKHVLIPSEMSSGMLDIELRDYASKKRVDIDARDKIMAIVHKILGSHMVVIRRKSSFGYNVAGRLDMNAAQLDYILVISGSSNEVAGFNKQQVEADIKSQVAEVLSVGPHEIEVRYSVVHPPSK